MGLIQLSPRGFFQVHPSLGQAYKVVRLPVFTQLLNFPVCHPPFLPERSHHALQRLWCNFQVFTFLCAEYGKTNGVPVRE